ncbi:telomerase Cajal body protein 1-like isoform X2 [Artemia franciscana]|nr:hypothetical protein QYM36_016796 [Artemia franciscana]
MDDVGFESIFSTPENRSLEATTADELLKQRYTTNETTVQPLVGVSENQLLEEVSELVEERLPALNNEDKIWNAFLSNSWTSVGVTKQWKTIPKGCKFAPDGSCVISAGEDNVLRCFNTPQRLWTHPETQSADIDLNEVVTLKEGGTVYDYQWYPLLNSWEPETCCLITTIKQGPVHMWNVDSNELVASYRIFNHLDELDSAYSVAFNPQGDKLYCGTDGIIYVFDTSRPGRDCEKRDLRKTGFKGIFSTIAVNPAMPSVYAVGSYLQTVSVNSEPDGMPLCILEGHVGGVTQIAFHQDGHLLASGGRKDDIINIWDLRYPGKTYLVFNREVTTHQKIQFNFCNKYLISGNTNGNVTCFDLVTGAPQERNFSVDCVNGVSINPKLPLIAISCGQRHFYIEDNDAEKKYKLKNEDLSLQLVWSGPLG